MMLKCEQCKDEFKSDRSNKKYCSMKCYGESKRGKEPDWLKNNRGVKPKNRLKSICVVCSKHFEHEANRDAKYCSKECWGNRSPKVLKSCKQCGLEFISYLSDKKDFCNKGCYSKWQKDNFKPSLFMKNEAKKSNSGANHYNWKGGTTAYFNSSDRDWYTIRKDIYKRDNYECQRCKKHGGRLECHHIIPYRISNDNSENNLITLCPKCHREVENDTGKFNSKEAIKCPTIAP